MIIAAALTQQALPSTCCVNSSRLPSHFWGGGGNEQNLLQASSRSEMPSSYAKTNMSAAQSQVTAAPR